jgi:hypothetical protein
MPTTQHVTQLAAQITGQFPATSPRALVYGMQYWQRHTVLATHLLPSPSYYLTWRRNMETQLKSPGQNRR